MNSKVILFGGLVAIGGWFLFKRFYGQGAVAGNTITPYANPQLQAQPSLQYPFQANQAPRNDNQSQPWYGGSRAFNTQVASQSAVDSQNFQANVGYVKGFADITSSLSSVWDDLGVGDWFSGEDDSSLLEASSDDFAGDNGESFNWDSLTYFA